MALSVVRRDIFDKQRRCPAAKGLTLAPERRRSLYLCNVFASASPHELPRESPSPVLNTDLSTLRAACQDVLDATNWLQGHSYLRFHLAALMDHMGWIYSHSINVATLTAIMALRLGLARSQRVELAAGALLHDVGNIFVPTELLNRPGLLSRDERLAVSRHTNLGESMLTRSGVPYRIACIVGQHHERWGGQGYPRRLKGPNIDLGAQIVGVADVFDALTSVRPHRAATELSEAKQQLLQRRDIDFHAAIIALLFRQD